MSGVMSQGNCSLREVTVYREKKLLLVLILVSTLSSIPRYSERNGYSHLRIFLLTKTTAKAFHIRLMWTYTNYCHIARRSILV